MGSAWWVNQEKSWPVESTLEVLWAPLHGSRGQRVPHFGRLTELQPGDTVFHYTAGCVVAVSEVLTAAEQRHRPYDPDDRIGHLVRVRVRELDRYVPLREIPETVRTQSARAGSAFDGDAGVANGYVFRLLDPALSVVAELAGLRPIGPAAELAERSACLSGDPVWFTGAVSNGTRVGSYRLEQPALRRELLGGRQVAPCDFCGRTLPARLLVTAHIKPRAHCTFEERTDLHVAVLACVLGCEALFEHGYITVDTVTGMIRGHHHTPGTDIHDAIGEVAGRRFSRLTRHNAEYFRWHTIHHGHQSEQAGLVPVNASESSADPGTIPPEGEEHPAELP